MTGFGRGTAERGATTATVELRSVNNRFCEVSLRTPRALGPYESEIQSQVKAAIERGRVTVNVQVTRSAEEALPIRVNEPVAHAYGALLRHLAAAAGIDEGVRLEHLLAFSDVFTTPDEDAAAVDVEAWEATQAALADALKGLQAMRRQEGEALRTDLALRLDLIERELAEVERRAPERVGEARQKLHDRLADLLGDERVNPDRLEMEIAFLADKLDVTEECVRLRSHLHLFREALGTSAAVGRKLNFLVQEINREVNTIGSKANDAEVAHRAVQMKEELERIREQVQNVE